jgi:hypothetical protein
MYYTLDEYVLASRSQHRGHYAFLNSILDGEVDSEDWVCNRNTILLGRRKQAADPKDVIPGWWGVALCAAAILSDIAFSGIGEERTPSAVQHRSSAPDFEYPIEPYPGWSLW